MLTVCPDTATTPACLASAAHVCCYAPRSHDVFNLGYRSQPDSEAEAVARYLANSEAAAAAPPLSVVCACASCANRFRVYAERLQPYDHPETGPATPGGALVCTSCAFFYPSPPSDMKREKNITTTINNDSAAFFLCKACVRLTNGALGAAKRCA